MTTKHGLNVEAIVILFALLLSSIFNMTFTQSLLLPLAVKVLVSSVICVLTLVVSVNLVELFRGKL